MRLEYVVSVDVDPEWLKKQQERHGITKAEAVARADQEIGFALSDACSFKEAVTPGSTAVTSRVHA